MEKQINLNVPCITYLRNEKGHPVACVAYSRVQPEMLKFGFSCHNPSDKFNRKLAKEIATGRFNGAPMFFHFDVPEASLHDILHDLMLKLEQGEYNAPARVMKAARNYIEQTRPPRPASIRSSATCSPPAE